MQQLRLEELMRYVLAGAVGLVALLLSFRDLAAPIAAAPGITQASLLVFIALALGSLVYAAHRAFLYPLLYRLALLLLVALRVYRSDARLFLPLVPAPLEVDLDTLRWKRTKDDHYAQPRLAEWGAQVHFLYCSSWAVLLMLWLGDRFGQVPTAAKPLLLRGAWLVLFVGFLSNCRLVYFDSRLALRDNPNLAPVKPRVTGSGSTSPSK